MTTARVAVLMGSSSDHPVMKGAVEMLDRFGVAHELALVTVENTVGKDELHRNSLTLEQ